MPEPSSTPAALAQRQLDAYNAGDLEAFLACYDPACRVRAFPSGQIMMADREAMRARYGPLFAEHPELHAHLEHRIEHECFAVDHERVVGLRPDETVYAVALYEVRDGLIRDVWFLREDATR